MKKRICNHCGKEIESGAVKDEEEFYHFDCVSKHFGIKFPVF